MEISFTRKSERVLTHVEPIGMTLKELLVRLNSKDISLGYDAERGCGVIKDAAGVALAEYQECQSTASDDEDTDFTVVPE